MNSEEGENELDGESIGQIAKSVPEKAWLRLVDTACDTFERLLAPITATTSGLGRLIDARFDKLTGPQKVLAADTLSRAIERSSNQEQGPNPQVKVIIQILEESSLETDINLRDLWANLLAQEISGNEVHPEVIRILSRLAAEDAVALAAIASRSKGVSFAMSTAFSNSLAGTSISIFGLSMTARPRKHSNFSEAMLENLGLIERLESQWVLSTVGEEFIRSVSPPNIENKI